MGYKLVDDGAGKRYRGFDCDMNCEHLSTIGQCCYLYSKRLDFKFDYLRCEECIEFGFPRREDEIEDEVNE